MPTFESLDCQDPILEEYIVKVNRTQKSIQPREQIAMRDLSENYYSEPRCKADQNASKLQIRKLQFEEEGSTKAPEAEMSTIQCFILVVKLAIPPIISMFFQFFVQLINTFYVGRLGDPVIMGGVGMGNMLINVFCFAVTNGLNSALETLVSQSYGFGKFQQCGVFLNRGRLVVTLILIPIALIFLFSDQILIAIGQDEQISVISKYYIVILLPGIWAMTQFDASRKFMIAQRKSSYPLYIQSFTMTIHLILCHIFVMILEWGFVGTAIATNITYFLNMILSDLILIKHDDFKETRSKLDLASFQKWFDYLQIGIPGALMLCFEWWAFELLAIFSGYMSVNSLAAEVIIINIVSFIFMMPLGISFAASSLTGNFIGQRNIALAKKFANLTMLLNLMLTVIVLMLIIFFNEEMSKIFTTDEDISEIIKNVLWIIIAYVFFDSIHGVQAGIIKGLGRQSYGSVFTLVCYYCFGMPLALTFAFKMEMGVGGLWLGFTIASLVLDIGFFVIIRTTNWEKVAYLISKRVEKEEIIRRAAVRKLKISNNNNLSNSEELNKLMLHDSFHSQIALSCSRSKYRI